MNFPYEPRLSARDLRNFLEALGEGADLARDPVTRLLAPLPAFGGGPEPIGEDQDQSAAVARGLRAFWRRHFMPPVLSSERRTAWNYYFLLEVMYFFPYAQGRRYPETLKDAAVLLCDESHLALIVANGDEAEAAQLLQANRTFWKGIVPATMIPAQQTIYSRRNAALEKLASALNRQLGAGERIGRQASVLTHEVVRDVPAVVPNSNPDAPSMQESLLPRITRHQTATKHIQGDNEPLSPNARRLLDAYQPALIGSSQPVPVIAPPLPEAYSQALLNRLTEQVVDIQPAQVDELALWLDALGFPETFGVKRSYCSDGWWWDDERLQRLLVERFGDSAETVIQIQCAAALRQSSLTALIRTETNWPGLGVAHWVNALQAISDVALRSPIGSQRRGIALAVLARPEHARRLASSGERYYPLLHELASPQIMMPRADATDDGSQLEAEAGYRLALRSK